jgi:hypothetical protein
VHKLSPVGWREKRRAVRQSKAFSFGDSVARSDRIMIRRALIFTAMLGLARVGFSASFVVPKDRDFIGQARAIVIASALASRTEVNDDRIVTVTTMSIEEVLKGDVANDAIEVYEPGGFYKDRLMMLPGVPRFKDGDRYLLFLTASDDGRWHALDLVLGKFNFATDSLGHDVVVRDVGDVLTLDNDGSKHQEATRAAQPFIDFIRQTSKGGPTKENYAIPVEPLIGDWSGPRTQSGGLKRVNLTTFSATSYTLTLTGAEGGAGGRWCGTIVAGSCTVAFPTAVTFHSINSEPGASGTPAGADAINTAMNAWNTAPGASINYAYGGNDATGTTNAPNAMTGDGKNTIAFEYDLQANGNFGAPFVCGSGGVLGLGGISAASGSHTGPNGESFFTVLESDVWMNKGIANCTTLFTSGDFDSGVTHEVGHTLGFRHANQQRTGATPCSGDASLECATSAIMTAIVTGGLHAALQAWDQHAAAGVYPGPVAPAAPTGVQAHATTATNVQVSWSGTCVTTCHVYRSSDRTTYTLAGSSATSPFNDTVSSTPTAYLYKVRAFNGTESVDSNLDLATTQIFANDPLVGGTTTIQALHLTQLRTAVDAVRKLANNGVANPGTYTDPTITAGSTFIKALHITDLRSALDPAMTTLQANVPTLLVGGYTDSSLGGVNIKAVHFQEIRDRLK